MVQRTLTGNNTNSSAKSADKNVPKVEKGTTKAHEMAAKQRDIGVAEFFAKNRHLLGFDNKRKSLLTTIKEAVDNSLDACEEAGILPEINVEIIDMGNDRFRVIVEDNGPGILKSQIPKIFAKLLYGSKFHRLKMSRGQQGIGISASVMYGQLTTGKPAKIISKIKKDLPANYYELHIDTQKNKPEIVKEATLDWEKDQGTRIELDLEGSYQKGSQSVDQYLKQTAIANPHVTIIYTTPKAEQVIFPRATENLPKETAEIKPHPYGVELGVLIRMLKLTPSKTLQQFFTQEFSRVGNGTAKQICENARIPPNTKPRKVSREMADKLIQSIKETKIISPPSDCIAPIGEEELEKGLKKEINAEFYCSITRPPNVYRGNPFLIEAAIAYGGEQQKEGSINIYRYANRVPLLFQQGACAATKSAQQTNWRGYGLSQSSGALPQGPITIAIHMASVWVPFTSESKEAIAHYPEIIKEIKLAIQECGRKLGSYLAKKKRIGDEFKKRSFIEIYIPHVAEALKDLIGISEKEIEQVELNLQEALEKKRGAIEKVGFDKGKNIEYDEEFAKIGKEVIKEAKEEIDALKGKKVDEEKELKK
ncbi:DNA topoisomerase VI subunit B [Candidatus Woesearchaeota archaeon]|jgi:DNA topoisomerase VI subunit B|nr:DNA topoisomerase VI subunit B [Candidatus Woesearchaeota archaeon]MBT5273063.1 DNA topoisomerase VI subunit B [Candidatus Woesearchaeota archaeon]MBT6040801.1 DNA topoisomerase VI subunit B [Candidatus Woesearchaeota archaeon]MBT6337622.1 DNA topoisomerase VI subunit B [Candidatus Woesearchaeota archaeon]MBT7926977.1 DNA topoisomerase VI subunit B [Candidatus Woesearchaeota archaeon]